MEESAEMRLQTATNRIIEIEEMGRKLTTPDLSGFTVDELRVLVSTGQFQPRTLSALSRICDDRLEAEIAAGIAKPLYVKFG